MDENSFGHTWYFFEQELQYPVDMIRFDKVNSVSLDGINTLVIPNGGYRFSEETLEGMKEWVADGGRIIAFDGGAKALADKDGFELRNKTEGKPQDTPPPYQQAERYHISDQLPGAIIKTVLDPTHPLSYGLNGTYFSLKTNSNAFQQNNKRSTAIRIGDQVEAFGFIGSRVKTQLNNSPIATVQQIGNGSVVYLVDNPLFRSFCQTGKILFANALFF